jgi:hypothetical protein
MNQAPISKNEPQAVERPIDKPVALAIERESLQSLQSDALQSVHGGVDKPLQTSLQR